MHGAHCLGWTPTPTFFKQPTTSYPPRFLYQSLKHLLTAVKVVPLAASAAPVIVRSLRVGKVVGVLGLHVVEACSLVEICSLGIQRRSVLAVKSLENLLISGVHQYTTCLRETTGTNM